MLILAKSANELSFEDLMEIYIEDNREHGAELWPEKSEQRPWRPMNAAVFEGFWIIRFGGTVP